MRDARAGRPRKLWWSLAAMVACVALQLASSSARADQGTVELRSGAAVHGDLVAVLPRDRVVAILPDGTSITIPWSEIAFVFDGSRVFDSAGNATVFERPAAPPSPPPPPPPSAATEVRPTYVAPPPVPGPRFVIGPVRGAPIGSAYLLGRSRLDVRSMRVAGNKALLGAGGFFLLSGLALFITEGALSGTVDPGIAAAIFATPASFSVGVGGLMVARGGRRARTRHRILLEPGAPYPVAGSQLAIGLDVAVANSAFVPRLSIRF